MTSNKQSNNLNNSSKFEDSESSKKPKGWIKGAFINFLLWFDSDAVNPEEMQSEKINWVRSIPFIVLHLACFGVIWVGWSFTAVITAVLVYTIQMFMVIGFYHRYFSHKTFKTGRIFQFLAALIGEVAIQKGALWWAANHRHHHKHSDQDEDVHSPTKKGFWWSHVGWIMADKYFMTDYKLVSDFDKFPELRILNRFDIFVPIFAGTSSFLFGMFLESFYPSLGVTAGQMLVWGYFIPTVLSLHGTFTVNSLAHVWGSRRFNTTDTSRNNLLLSILTLGEGWHNNHHRFQATAKSGFYWWEVDMTYYGLRILSWFGLVWDLRMVPESIYKEAKETKLVFKAEKEAKKKKKLTAKKTPNKTKTNEELVKFSPKKPLPNSILDEEFVTPKKSGVNLEKERVGTR